MWQSKGINFVIDGCHRVSALIAWVLDDYGDGTKSNSFFSFNVGGDQRRTAEKTQALIKKKIGTYREMMDAVQHPKPREVRNSFEYARLLVTRPLQLQWIPGADPKKAEKSFFTINQAGAAIEPTELRILEVRTTPNALAARAIVRAGTGHKYWARFAKDKQESIESLAADIHKSLFMPPLETPIKTLDLPIAGKGYASLPLVFDMVNLDRQSPENSIAASDPNGDETINVDTECNG